MTNNIVNHLFNLNNSYKNWVFEDMKVKLTAAKVLLDNFSVVYYNELEKLPYRLNLMDDLSTNENAHSKFLIRLLQYQPALLNFLKFVNDNNHDQFLFNIPLIKKPVLTYEKMRIDGLIKENNKYAIIIENKIHNAVEQQHQIGRYITKCKSIGFKTEQIFIIYLTKTKKENHSEQTWGLEHTQTDFNTRYCKLSYRSEILPWLESYLGSLLPKEELIKSAVVQYIDHLKHFFNKREIHSNMNRELQTFLAQQLDFTSDNIENIDIVSKKIHEIKQLKEQLEVLERASKERLFEEWKNYLIERFQLEDNQVFYQSKDSFIKTGVKLNYKGKHFSVLIEHNFNSVYYGFGRHFTSANLDSELKEFLASLVSEQVMKEEEPWWYGWKYTSLIDGYLELENLIKLVTEKIELEK